MNPLYRICLAVGAISAAPLAWAALRASDPIPAALLAATLAYWAWGEIALARLSRGARS